MPEAAPSAAPATPSTSAAPAKGSSAPAKAPEAAATPTPTPSAQKWDFGEGERDYTPEQIRTWAMKGRSHDKMAPKQEARIREAEARAERVAKLDQLAEAGDTRGMVEAISKWKGMTPERAIALADAMAEQHLLPQLQAQQLSPEQRFALEQRQRADNAERELKSIQAQKEEAERAKYLKEAHGQVIRRLDGALQSIGLSADTGAPLLQPLADRLEHIAELNAGAAERGEEPLNFSDAEVAQMVRDEARNLGSSLTKGMNFKAISEFYGWDASQLWNGMTGADVISLLGPAMNLVRKAEYDRIVAARNGGIVPAAPPPKPAADLPKKTVANPNGYLSREQMLERGIT